ncbi:hypothetical protein P7C70_g7452, partial [Phenoliferia sp. Uapishka_3]
MSKPVDVLAASRLSTTVPCPEAPTHPNLDKLPLLDRTTIATRIANGELLILHLPLVYRIPTAWLDMHPGRDLAILHGVGRDMSNEIEGYHSGRTVTERMRRWVVGRVEVGEDGWRDMVPPIQRSMWPPPVPKITISPATPALESADMDAKEADRIQEIDGGPQFLTAELVDPPIGDEDSLPLTPAYQHHLRQSHRRLQAHLQQLGLDTPPKPLAGYGGVIPIYLGLLVLWVYLYSIATTSLGYFASAVALGAWWHQITFLGHDMGHTHITGHWWTDRLLGVLVADFLGGLSIVWWCDNHNIHHIVTNMPEHDPDIQHLPFFAITNKFFQNLKSTYYNRIMVFDKFAQFILPYQHTLYYPIMCLARFNLLALSYTFLITKVPARSSPLYNFRLLEIFGITCFWTWMGAILKAIPGSGTRIMFLMVSFAVTSPLHVQIVLSHFSQPVSVTDDMIPHSELLESHMHRQLRTTMDISCPTYLDFLHGGLNFQTPHHVCSLFISHLAVRRTNSLLRQLFPRLPRFRFRAAALEVEKWVKAENELVKNGYFNGKKLKKNEGLVYKRMYFVEANQDVLGVLKSVGQQVKLLGQVAKADAKAARDCVPIPPHWSLSDKDFLWLPQFVKLLGLLSLASSSISPTPVAAPVISLAPPIVTPSAASTTSLPPPTTAPTNPAPAPAPARLSYQRPAPNVSAKRPRDESLPARPQNPNYHGSNYDVNYNSRNKGKGKEMGPATVAPALRLRRRTSDEDLAQAIDNSKRHAQQHQVSAPRPRNLSDSNSTTPQNAVASGSGTRRGPTPSLAATGAPLNPQGFAARANAENDAGQAYLAGDVSPEREIKVGLDNSIQLRLLSHNIHGLNVEKLAQYSPLHSMFPISDIIVWGELKTGKGGMARLPNLPAEWSQIESSRPNSSISNLHSAQGGIGILFRSHLNVTVSKKVPVIPNTDLVWLDVGDVTIGCVYLRPEGSRAMTQNSSFTMDSFSSALSQHIPSRNTKIIITGDTNSRLGINQATGPPRFSKDIVYLGRGPRLMSLLRAQDLVVLNGAVGTDLAAGGEATCFVNGAATTIDHSIVSSAMLPQIVDFR